MRDCRGHIHGARRGATPPTVPLALSTSLDWRNRGRVVTSEPAKAHTTAGDLSEFSSLVDPYRQELHLDCYRMLGSLHDAEDLVQETMLPAWHYGDTCMGHASLLT